MGLKYCECCFASIENAELVCSNSFHVISLETDDLAAEAVKYQLGVKEIETTYGEGKTVKTIIYDEMQLRRLDLALLKNTRSTM